MSGPFLCSPGWATISHPNPPACQPLARAAGASAGPGCVAEHKTTRHCPQGIVSTLCPVWIWYLSLVITLSFQAFWWGKQFILESYKWLLTGYPGHDTVFHNWRTFGTFLRTEKKKKKNLASEGVFNPSSSWLMTQNYGASQRNQSAEKTLKVGIKTASHDWC